jgi:toxin ParE1/3/4
MVIWSVPAQLDLHAIHDYIAIESRYYAIKVIEEIVELSETIEFFPERGRIVPEYEDSTVRELFLYSYRLIYEIRKKDAYILAVIHGTRDISKITLNKSK